MNEEELHSILSEADINKNGQVELDEYLELMSAMKVGAISQNRLARQVEYEYYKNVDDYSPISVERSGGGL